MDFTARIVPNHLGQPYKVAFQKDALTALGTAQGERVTLTLEDGDVLALRPDPDGAYLIRAMDQRKGQPYVSASGLLAGPNERAPLSRAPKHATVSDGALWIHLRRDLSDADYRYRRFVRYQRNDATMNPDGALDLHHVAGRNVMTPVPLPTALRRELEQHAERLKLTVPTLIVQVLQQTDLAGVQTPMAPDWRGGGWQVRAARQGGSALTADELISRGIPPASDLDWLRARVAEGMSYAEMARQFGGGPSVYAHWGKEAGIQRKPRRKEKQ